MKIPSLCNIALFCLTIAASTPAVADGLRCGTRLVSTGDTRYKVRSVCGEPDDVIERTELRLRGQAVEVLCPDVEGRSACIAGYDEQVSELQIDEWIYDLGKNRLVQRLTFEQGVLTRIESVGERGVAR